VLLAPRRSRPARRELKPVELALALSLAASVLAVAVPAFVREVHASRFVEPVDGLHRIGESAAAFAAAQTGPPCLPGSAPMTPPSPPRGHCEPDAPGTWDHPTWEALRFRPAPEGAPHCFAFAFESSSAQNAPDFFRAHAHGDLDGDGIPSTFQITGRCEGGRAVTVDPGMLVENEVE
jgi:hypothetical protein